MKIWYWIIFVFVIITTINNVQRSTPTIVLITMIMTITIIRITNAYTALATTVHHEYDFQQSNNKFMNLLFTFRTHGLSTQLHHDVTFMYFDIDLL